MNVHKNAEPFCVHCPGLPTFHKTEFYSGTLRHPEQHTQNITLQVLLHMKMKIRFLLIGVLFFASTLRAQVPPVRGMYVNFIQSWLGDTLEENKILNYCNSYYINYVTIYDLNLLSWNSTQKNQLASFISRAKTRFGITQIGAAGETYNFFKNYIVPYNTSRSLATERFDVFNYEFEFWLTSSIASYYGPNYLTPNGFTADTAGAFAFSLQQFTKIDSLCNVYSLLNEIYLGWPTQGQMQRIASIADRILLHAYRTSDVDVYQYTQSRLYDILTLNRNIQVMPIFSSEPTFMGPWLTLHPITQPYTTYSSYYQQEPAYFKQNIQLQGYQWFLYSLMPKTSIANASISTSGPTSFCSGGNVTLTASAGASYLWSPGGQTTSSILVNTSGTYAVTITNAAGGSATSPSITVSVTSTGPAPVITASGPVTFCNGGTVTLSCSSAANYLWSNGATTQSIFVNTSGNYTVSTTTNGCTQTSPATTVAALTSPATPTVTASGALTICPGKLLTLTSSAANGYLWSNGATTRAIVVSAAGTYSVRVYSGSNCYTNSATQTVSLLTAPATPVITANGSTTLTTSHPSVVLTSTVAPAYSWSTLQTTRSITATAQGSYVVTVSNTNGCSASSAAVAVSANGCTPPAVPVISASGSTVLTSGQSVTLTSTLAGGYLWSIGATTRSITVNTAGTYTVRAYNAGYCFSTSTPLTVLVLAARMMQDNSIADVFESSLTAYPNPVHGTLYLNFNATTPGEGMLRITDLSGRELLNNACNYTGGSNVFSLDLSSFPSGIYFVNLSGKEEKRLRIVVE